jgi:hypothetical protein
MSDWQTISEAAPTRISFDTDGDVFIGTYEGEKEIAPPNMDAFSVYLFHAADGNEGLEDGELVAINQYYDLQEAMSKVSPGTLCRIERVKTVETKRNQNPMVSFLVQTKA